MTISNSDRTAGPFIGNGVTTAFPFSFKVFSRTDLLVARTDASGNETILTLDADYSVTLNSNQSTTPGGTVTLPAPLATGFTLAMTSNIALVQSLDLTNNGGFYPDQINGSLDRIVVMVQQVAAKVGGSLNVGGAAVAQLAGKLMTSAGAFYVGFIQAGAGAAARNVQDKLYDSVSALDFMTPAQRASVRAGDGTSDVTAAVQAAISASTCVRFPAGVYKMTGGLTQGAKKIHLQGDGNATKFLLSGPLFAATQSDNEKNYQVTINDLELNSTTGYSYRIDYGYQSANQENGVKFNRVRFTGADGVFLQRTAGLQFNSCQWDRLTGTALYARLVVNLEVNGGLINACGVPFNVDGDSAKATETAGIAFNGTRIIGCGAGSIKYCDQPSMNNVLYDFNGTLTLAGNIGGRFSGYFGSGSTHIIDYTAGVIGSSLTGRFTHYNNGVTLKLNGPIRVHDACFQDAFTHIYLIGTGAQITGNYFQKSAPNTRSINADPGTTNVTVADCIFEFLGSGCEAFPASIPDSWQFSNNRGTELDTVKATAIVPASLTNIITNLPKKRAPKSAVCNTEGFRVDWANQNRFSVSAANSAPSGQDQAVTVSFSY